MGTEFQVVIDKFRSLPQTKFLIPESLEIEWLNTAISDYELNLGEELPTDTENGRFVDRLSNVTIRTLAQMMYVSYLQRELSRVMALNGIYGKDLKVTGQDATKRVTKQELDSQVALVETLLHRQKTAAYN